MKRRIRIHFTDFWDTFNPEDNYFTNLLNELYDLVFDPVNPEILFYSVFGTNFFNYNCIRIFYTGENVRPDFNQCDWSFSFDYSNNPKNYRLPLYAIFPDVEDLIKPRDPEKMFSQKTEFCSFIYSNTGPKKRKKFFYKLSGYKFVHSAGRFLNNIGGPLPGFVEEKREFIKKFKFTFAFENSSYPGYTTEKILDPLLCGSIPLYWGNELVYNDFNPKSFLNYHNYSGDEEFLDEIIRYDSDKNLVLDMLSQPPFENNIMVSYADKNNLINRFKYILSQNIIPVSDKYFTSSKPNKLWRIRYNLTMAKYNAWILQKKILDFSVNKILARSYRFFENKK